MQSEGMPNPVFVCEIDSSSFNEENHSIDCTMTVHFNNLNKAIEEVKFTDNSMRAAKNADGSFVVQANVPLATDIQNVTNRELDNSPREIAFYSAIEAMVESQIVLTDEDGDSHTFDLENPNYTKWTDLRNTYEVILLLQEANQ